MTKITGARHVDFAEDTAVESARKIVRMAIEGYKRRKGKTVDIPGVRQKVVAGSSAEVIVGALAKLDAADPLKPLIDNIVAGSIRGSASSPGATTYRRRRTADSRRSRGAC